MGPRAELHSIIDLTPASEEVELDWSICHNQATGSDHELIRREVVRAPPPLQDTVAGKETTGWDIS